MRCRPPVLLTVQRTLPALDELDGEKARLVTDDCSLFELTGRPVQLTQGDYANLKITTRRICPARHRKRKTCALVTVMMFTVWWRIAS